MGNTIKVKSEYNSLDTVLDYLKKESPYECSKEYDSWDVRTDANGQMEQCVLIKKSSMHGMKVHFNNENELVMAYTIPSKVMNAYFGESKRARQSIIHVITGGIKKALLSGGQKKAFEEMQTVVLKMAN